VDTQYNGMIVSFNGIPTMPRITGFALNTWHSFAISYQSAGPVKFYLNGAEVASATGATLSTAVSVFALGTNTHNAKYSFGGYIDDFRIFNYAIPNLAALTAEDTYAVVMADSFNCASDARLKKNIVNLDGALDKIDSIRGVHYHWIDASQPQSRQVGVIAQEIQAAYPELVMEGGNGFLSVDYPKLTAVLIQSIKELKAMEQEFLANWSLRDVEPSAALIRQRPDSDEGMN
jgi:hypothetical protein